MSGWWAFSGSIRAMARKIECRARARTRAGLLDGHQVGLGSSDEDGLAAGTGLLGGPAIFWYLVRLALVTCRDEHSPS